MLYIAIIMVIVVLVKMPTVKGMIGELSIALTLKFLDKEKYHIFHDIYIPLEDGTTSQIDHVIISEYGIFVIETKNYKGWIFGNEKGLYWTQTIYKNKSKFYNPILQNKNHVKYLSNFLQIDVIEKFHSIIVFSMRATLKKVETTTPVVYSIGLNRRIKKYKNEELTADEIKEAINKISSLKKLNYKERKEHVKNIHKKLEERKNICPKCGKNLVKRFSKEVHFGDVKDIPNAVLLKQSVSKHIQ